MTIDFLALYIAIGLLLFYFGLRKWKNKFKKAAFYHSSLTDFLLAKPVFREKYAFLPAFFLIGALLLGLIAFLDPHTLVKKQVQRLKQDPEEGRLILIALDHSGSMKDPITDTTGFSRKSFRKLDLMKDTMVEFVKKREQDFIALEEFARTVHILVPFTQDHEEIIKAIEKIKPVSQDQDGTGIGYAIFKSTNLIASLKEQSEFSKNKPPYKILGAAIVLVTDGLQDPNPLDKDNPYRSMDVEVAAAYAKEKKVKLYMVNIEPSLGQEQFLPNIRQMKRVAALTGGKFYLIQEPSDLNSIFQDIDQLEKSEIAKTATFYERLSYYPYFLSAAIGCFLAAILLHYTLFRRLA